MKKLTLILAVLAIAVLATSPVWGGKKDNGENGTTLAAYKTIDICSVDENTWRYSGEIAVWNEGAIDTVGFAISDFIENKTGNKWNLAFNIPVNYSGEISAGTLQETALTFPYSIDAAPLDGYIRNNVSLTILNHSGHLDTPWGPNPKVTYDGEMPPPPCEEAPTCTYTQGYWGNKPGVVWPDAYSRDATFFLSGQTWQQVMDTPVNVSQGYYQLAHQYIAAVLNEANDASVPSGIQDTLDLALAWLGANGPSACASGGSCGTQKTWAGVLDTYNNGLYPDGPAHCGDE